MSAVAKEELVEVSLTRIRVNPHQPRRHFVPEEIEELAGSIKMIGLLHPPLVRPVGEGDYELISGERRFRALQMIGLDKVQVLVREASESLSAQAALVENIQRVDLNPIEVAKALKAMMEEFGYNQEELAKRVAKKRSTVANFLRLLSLPREIQESLEKNAMTMGHAKAVLSLPGMEQRHLLHNLILRDELTVREAEQAARRIANKSEKKKLVYANRDFYLEQLVERIQERLGTKVVVQGKGKKGKICISYYDLDDLDRILAILGVSSE